MNGEITPKQVRYLMLAVREGYYQIPRQTTQRELADEVGVSVGTFSQMLRRAENRIISAFAVGSPLDADEERTARVTITITDEISFALGGDLADDGYPLDVEASEAARQLLEEETLRLGVDLGYVGAEASVEIDAAWLNGPGIEMPEGDPCRCEPHAAGPYRDDPDDPDGVERCETCGGWNDRV